MFKKTSKQKCLDIYLNSEQKNITNIIVYFKEILHSVFFVYLIVPKNLASLAHGQKKQTANVAFFKNFVKQFIKFAKT